MPVGPLSIFCLVLPILGLLAPPVSLAESFPSEKTMTVPAVVATVRPSVVSIVSRGGGPHAGQHQPAAASGSGFIIDASGFILTNNHLVEGSRNAVVGLPGGALVPGRVVARDFLLDLAVVKIAAKNLAVAPLGRSSTLQIGETVVAIGTVGNPRAAKSGASVTTGVVSGLDQAILPPNGETLYNLIQTDAAINPGNSGGPLVDLSGHVVGITVAVAPSAQAISYAISIDAIVPHVRSMLVRGSVLRPDLGFIPVTVTPSVAVSFNLYVDHGVMAAQVKPGTPAGMSGLQDGDVITAIDQTPIYNMGDLWHLLLEGNSSFPAQLTVYGRNGQFSELSMSRAAPSP